jgi:hypothetical protein
MCLRCDGWSEREVLDWYRDTIKTMGWAIVAVQAEGPEAGFAYTVGLTRFHGHSELLVTGLKQNEQGAVLNDLGRQVSEGAWFRAGELLRVEHGRTFQFIQVDDPNILAEAQTIYSSSETGLVPALQVVYTDRRGRWPWDTGWPAGQRMQPLLGTPVHR